MPAALVGIGSARRWESLNQPCHALWQVRAACRWSTSTTSRTFSTSTSRPASGGRPRKARCRMGFRVFKTTFTNHKGKRQEAASWFVEFKDHNQSVRRLTGFTSKAASEEMGRGLVKLVEFHVASGGQIAPAPSSGLPTLPHPPRQNLVATAPSPP